MIPRIIGNQGTSAQLAIKISINNQNPNHSDSAGNHDSVKALDSQVLLSLAKYGSPTPLATFGKSYSQPSSYYTQHFEYHILVCTGIAISVKAGSFNAITVEKFSLITVVVCRIKMNWAKFLFSILKKMVSPGSKQAKGFAIQISLLLATFPSLELGESSEFPDSKVLTKKTVHRFVSVHDRDGAEEVTGAAKKKAVSKKRPAADVGAAVPKKKRTFKKKSVSSMELVAVAEEALPIQQVAEPLDLEEPRCSSADAVDLIIQQVLDETRAADALADISQPAVSEEKHWFDLPYDDLVKQWEAERPVVTASDI
ncbi:hypothetical protein F511_33745 [Dorcoceras hygrometricum]|uniref:Uncharacterized protein n=1 Tax=Dorcoceras hygrometricum TaxID=472368 RepID=A0A2Z7BNF8_9LAMI|nr:hypothetical protein F511_33745 [Dorcoceras hygrometricum]